MRSVNRVSIGSGNRLSPVWCQAITWNNAAIWILRNKRQWNSNRNSYIFIDENAFENVVCEITAVLYKGGGGRGELKQINNNMSVSLTQIHF